MPFCPNCGAEKAEVGAFCTKCGTSLVVSTADPRTGQPPQQPPPVRLDREQVALASQAAVGAAATMQFQTYVQRACPACFHHMIVVFRRPWLGRIIALVGLLMLLIPVLGWITGPFVILTGIVLTIVQKGKARYQCPGCNYST
jgi:predicted RNA-binding Zn-ribbon protein involved in translation (DUF1610 family)